MDPEGLLDIPTGDPAAMRIQARVMLQAAEETRRLTSCLDARVRATPYEGPQARAFRLRMTDYHHEALRIAARLEELGQRLAGRAVAVAAAQDRVTAALHPRGLD